MRKINKLTNIVLIFILLGISFLNPGYAFSQQFLSLRPPLISDKDLVLDSNKALKDQKRSPVSLDVIYEKLTQANIYKNQGPLDKAIEIYNSILELEPNNPKAIYSLAEIYGWQYRFDKAIETLIRGTKANPEDMELLNLLLDIKYRKETIKDLEENGIKNGYINKMVFTDGKLDRIAFPGTWDIRIRAERKVNTAMYMRIAKSLALTIEDLFPDSFFAFDEIQIIEDIKELNSMVRGKQNDISIDQSKNIAIEIVNQEGKWHVITYVSYDFLNVDRFKQREIIKKVILNIKKERLAQKESISFESTEDHYEAVVEFMGTSKMTRYGQNVLIDRLRKNGIKINKDGANISCISVFDGVINESNSIMAINKQEHPERFNIVGGPSTKLIEHLAVALPEADIIIRGEGDEILPQVCKIIGDRKATEGLTEEQICKLKQLEGGVFIRVNPSRVIINKLNHVNSVTDLELPSPELEGNFWVTSRGCPFRCKFCNLIMGRGFRSVGVESKAGKRYMINWLIERLALEFSQQRPDTGKLLSMLESGVDLREQGLLLRHNKIRIFIEDDIFLLDKTRIKQLCRRIKELGLNRYFIFRIVQTSIKTLYNNNNIDTELIDMLQGSGFTYIPLGTDGPTTRIINQMNKGYTIQKAIALNNELRKRKFHVRHNVLLTTPLTSPAELAEAAMLYYLLPFEYVTYASRNATVKSLLGIPFTDMDLITYKNAGRGSNRHYKLNQDLAQGFNEYQFLELEPLTIADPMVNRIALSLEPFPLPDINVIDKVLNELGEEYTLKAIETWRSSDEPEIQALGKCFEYYNYKKTLVTSILKKIRNDMERENIFSFIEYLESLLSDNQLKSIEHAEKLEVFI